MDIVEQLRKYECMCTNEQCRSCAAADEIERLRKLVEEFLPYALREVEQGVLIGPPPEGDEFCQQCEQVCSDCERYNSSLDFLEKFRSGQFDLDNKEDS